MTWEMAESEAEMRLVRFFLGADEAIAGTGAFSLNV